MGYGYVGIGGMAKSTVAEIQAVLEAVRGAVSPATELHLFGFSRPEALEQIETLGLTSFDSTSPMIRAFKDARQNYLLSGEWYTAIRIPSADDNQRMKGRILQDASQQKALRRMERESLEAIRGYSQGSVELEDALDAIGRYGWEFLRPAMDDDTQIRKKRIEHERNLERYRRTLESRPWERCECRACRESGVEVLIFRGNNRNRRRGFHNLWQFYRRHKQFSAKLEASVHAL
jgi:hypothetical protein